MRRILTIVVFTLTTSILAFGQTNDKRVAQSQTQRELISLSREFVDSAIGKEIIVVEDASASTRKGATVANVRGEWQSVDLEKIKIRVEGDRALVTGQVAFKGQTIAGQPLDNSSNITIHFSRKTGQWKFVKGCLGSCD